MGAIDYATLVPELIRTGAFTFRVAACSLSIIAAMIGWRLRHHAERPPYNRHLNDIAWNWFHAGVVIGAIGFISLDLNYFRVNGSTLGDLIVAITWWCLANAATVRLAARAEQPRFVYLGATIFIVLMPIYALATGG